MKPWEIITLLETDNSRLFKESVIRQQAENNNDEFFSGLLYALDKLITFGVKQVPHTDYDGPGVNWDEFKDLLDCLKNRVLTGHAARDAIQNIADLSTIDQWQNWYRRILLKDLRCGVSEKTVNNVVKKSNTKYTIPVFTCQLAFDGEDHDSKMIGEKILENKLDGVRVLTIAHPGQEVTQFSRNGKELINFEAVRKQIAIAAKQLDQPYVFDGEIMDSNFQDLMKQVHRKENVNTDGAVLHLFDMIPLKDFSAGICHIKQKDRSKQLKEWFENSLLPFTNVTVVEQEYVNLSTKEGKARFNEINEIAIQGGYEGILIKDPNAPYELKRSTAWLKKKPIITVDLTIKYIEEGTGRNLDRLGAFVCEGVDNNRNIKVNCGSGFSDDQRINYWESRDELIGRTVEVIADAVTKNQDGTYSLRFPRFKGFRDDK